MNVQPLRSAEPNTLTSSPGFDRGLPSPFRATEAQLGVGVSGTILDVVSEVKS